MSAKFYNIFANKYSGEVFASELDKEVSIRDQVYNAMPNISHVYVDDSEYARYESMSYDDIYTGNIITVGATGDYATITEAYTAASSGDIIQLQDGTYLTTDEAGGFLLLNDTGKRVLIRGNSADNTACSITQNAAGTYTMFLNSTGMVVFEDLTIESDQNNIMILINGNVDDRNFIFKNCILEQTSSGSTSRIMNFFDSNTYTKHFEFNECTIINRNGGFAISQNQGNEFSNYLFIGCEIESDFGTVLSFTSNFEGNVYIYNNTIKQTGGNYVIIQLGQDTADPPVNLNNIDIRDNKIIFENGYYQHALLLGRGTVKRKIINNYIFVTSEIMALAIGIVDKTVATQLTDSILYGNYVEAPRPYYIKGASYNDVRYNTFIGNTTDFEAFGYVNYIGGTPELLSRYNRVTDNRLISEYLVIKLYQEAGESVDVLDCAKTSNINNNKTYRPSDYLFYDSTLYNFEDTKSLIWGAGLNDSESCELEDFHVPVRLIE